MILMFCGEMFLSLQEIQYRSLGNLNEGQLNTFNNEVHLNSTHHRPSSEPAFSSGSQDNPGNSWNQKIHHRVENSLTFRPILIRVNHGENLLYSFWKINFNIILPSLPKSSKWAPSFGFPKQCAVCISLLLVCATRFPLSSSSIL